MKRFFVFCFFFICRFAIAQNGITPDNNFEILRSLYSEISAEICAIIPMDAKNINIHITGDESNFIVENFLRENLKKSCNLDLNSENSLSILEIVQNTKIQYFDLPGNDDKFARDFKCLVSVRINQKGIINTKSFIKKFCDTLNISDQKLVDYNKIDVIKEKLKNKNIFEILFQPVVILAGLGIFVYLLFSIRSN
jgi:hypothetical protein